MKIQTVENIGQRGQNAEGSKHNSGSEKQYRELHTWCCGHLSCRDRIARSQSLDLGRNRCGRDRIRACSRDRSIRDRRERYGLLSCSRCRCRCRRRNLL